MKTHRLLQFSKVTLAMSAALLIASTAAQAQITTYTQYFNNGTLGSSGDKTLAVYNWSAAAGTSGTVHTGGAVTNFAVSQGTTNTLGVPVVAGNSTAAGFAFALPANDTSEATILYNTNLGTIDTFQDAPQGSWRRVGTQSLSGLTLGEINTVSFYARNGSTSPVMRLALQVGTTWYTSSSSYQTTQTANFEKFTLTNPVGINWYEGAFVPNVSLSSDVTLLPSVSLSSSSVITGYGLYSDIGGLAATDARVRMDSFEIATVPEPTTWALLIGSLAAAALLRRRRRN